MKTYFMLYSTDFEADDGGDHFDFEARDDVTPYTPTTAGDDERPQRVKPGKSRDSECRAFTMLASVCSYWYFTLTGWPHSPTPDWVRHQIKKRIERECHTLLLVDLRICTTIVVDATCS